MGNELEKSVAEILNGTKQNITSKAIKLLAMDLDQKFENVDKKLDTIVLMLKTDKEESKKEIKCINERIDKQEKKLEVVAFFSKHPKLLIILAVGLIFLIGFTIGHSKFLEIFKIV